MSKFKYYFILSVFLSLGQSFLSSGFSQIKNSNSTNFSLIYEPKFTRSISDTLFNFLRCTNADQPGYKFIYGDSLQNAQPTIYYKPEFPIKNKLESGWLYFYQAIAVSNPDTSEINFSYQDDFPPKIKKIKIDSVSLNEGRTNYIGKLSHNILTISVADDTTFKNLRYEKLSEKKYRFYGDTLKTTTGAGIAQIVISRSGGNFVDVSDTLWDKTNIIYTDTTNRRQNHPLWLNNLKIEPLLEIQGKYSFKVKLKDAAYHPDQVNNPTVLGNDTTHSYTVVYDTIPPEIDFSSIIDSLYTSNCRYFRDPDSLKLMFGITDTLSGVNWSTLRFKIEPENSVSINTNRSGKETDSTYAIWARFLSDGMFSLSVTIEDNSGNEAKKKKTFRADLRNSVLKGFDIRDLDFGKVNCFNPVSNYTDSSIVDILNFDPHLFPNSDSLVIRGMDSPKPAIVRTYPTSDTLEIDLKQLFSSPLESDKKYVLSISAKDSAGNIQTKAIPNDTIIFDNQNPVLDSVVVSDTTSLENDSTFIAFKGWTNDTLVNVKINSQDFDLYKLLEISPKKKCIDFQNTLLTDIDGLNNEWPFIFQMCDSAGNESNENSDSIKLDTKIQSLNERDVKVMDPSSKDTTYTDEKSVIIEFKNLDKFKWNGIPDLSRYFIDGDKDTVLFNLRHRIRIPFKYSKPDSSDENNRVFWIAVIDSAGNRSNFDRDTIRVVKQFIITGIELKDTVTTNMEKADSGWTNNSTVQAGLKLDVENGYSDLNGIDSICYVINTSDTTCLSPDSIKIIQPGNVVFPVGPLEKNKENTVKVWIIGPINDLLSDSDSSLISFDDLTTSLDSIVLKDPDTGNTKVTTVDNVLICPTWEKEANDIGSDSLVAFETDYSTGNILKRQLYLLTEGKGCYPFSFSNENAGFKIIKTYIKDLAGNHSETKQDTIYYNPDLLQIKLTIFDKSDYELATGQSNYPNYECMVNNAVIDSSFTDEKTVVVSVVRNKVAWNQIKTGNTGIDINDVPWVDIGEPDSFCYSDTFALNIDSFPFKADSVWAIARHKELGIVSNIDTFSINYDIKKPSLDVFNIFPERTTNPVVNIHWEGIDYDSSTALQGLFVYEILDIGEDGNKLACNISGRTSGDTTFNLNAEYKGWRTIHGFIADKASLDGQVPEKWWEKVNEDSLTSNIRSSRVYYGSVDNFSYPNPFNPSVDIAYFRLDKPVAGDVDILIYDFYGHLILKKHINGLRADWIDGKNKPESGFFWDGKDSHGKIVSNGTYIVQFVSDGKPLIDQPITIGVLR